MNPKIKAIIDKVEAKELTPAEGLRQLFALVAEESATKEDIKGIKEATDKIDALKKELESVAKQVGEIRVSGGDPRNDDKQRRGYVDLGEFARDVASAAPSNGGQVSERLKACKGDAVKAASDPASTSVGADVGFLIPPTFGVQLWEGALDESRLLDRTDRREAAGNSVYEARNKRPSEWSTTGVQAYWEGENAAIDQSKPQFEFATQRLHALKVLVPVSNESLEDTPYLASEIDAEGRAAIAWKADDAIINGDGVGKPLGMRASAAMISVAKVANQAADTIVAGNVATIWARMPARYKRNAVWLSNDDCAGQFMLMTIGDQPVYLAPTGLIQGAPDGTLMGRPLIPGQHCETLGDKYDFMLVDPKQYKVITKAGGIKTATSMHLWFDADQTAFRLVFRMSGQPKLHTAITPKRGANNLSAYVTLDARA